jgi:N-succinyldiaminopimelate aminotransferase
MYRTKRDRLVSALEAVGFDVFPCEGTYFVCAGFGRFGFDDDVAFCRHLIEQAGVVAIPPSAFYHHQQYGKDFVRFAFCKTDDVLDEAARRLRRLARSIHRLTPSDR